MIQIIGRNSDRETKKAIMHLKEHGYEFQFLDLDKRDLSKKEWLAILSSVNDANALINKKSKFYIKHGYEWMEYDPLEAIIAHPEMLTIPIIRKESKARVGFDMDFVKELLKCNI